MSGCVAASPTAERAVEAAARAVDVAAELEGQVSDVREPSTPRSESRSQLCRPIRLAGRRCCPRLHLPAWFLPPPAPICPFIHDCRRITSVMRPVAATFVLSAAAASALGLTQHEDGWMRSFLPYADDGTDPWLETVLVRRLRPLVPTASRPATLTRRAPRSTRSSSPE